MLELSEAEWQAVTLSLRVALVSVVASLPFGIAIAWLLARRQFPGKALVDGLVHLPLVVPPVVVGYGAAVFCSAGAARSAPGSMTISASR